MSVFGTLMNALSVVACFCFLKRFQSQSLIVLDGYIAIFRTFAEFLSATICLFYGIMETDLILAALGIACILTGILLKMLLHFYKIERRNRRLAVATYVTVALYVICTAVACNAFHEIAVRSGFVACATRMFTCVIPLVALGEAIHHQNAANVYFLAVVDIMAISILWKFCSNLSLKFFIVVPALVGLTLSGISWFMSEFYKWAATRIELK